MREHGAVTGSKLYEKNWHARARAQALMRLIVELRLAEKWEMSEHVERRGSGYLWSVEWKGPHGNRKDDDG